MHLLLLPAFLFAALRAIAFFPLGALPGLVYGLERLRVLRVVVGPDEELLPIESVADAERAAFEPVDLRMRRLDRVLAEDAGIPPPLHELGGVRVVRDEVCLQAVRFGRRLVRTLLRLEGSSI